MERWARAKYQPVLPMGENGQRITASEKHIQLSKEVTWSGAPEKACSTVTWSGGSEKACSTVTWRYASEKACRSGGGKFLHGTGYDKGDTVQADCAVHYPHYNWQYFSAALQYGRHHYCRALCRSGRAGGGGSHGFCGLPDLRLYAGADYGFHRDDSPAVWCGRQGGHEKEYRQRYYFVCLCHGDNDGAEHGGNGFSAALDEHAGRYF